MAVLISDERRFSGAFRIITVKGRKTTCSRRKMVKVRIAFIIRALDGRRRAVRLNVPLPVSGAKMYEVSWNVGAALPVSI